MVLWVITILSVIVLEFSFAMRTEVQITQNFQEELQLYAMAEGGIQRAVIELTFYHGLPYQDIARILNCPENTVKTRMFHARKKLQVFAETQED